MNPRSDTVKIEMKKIKQDNTFMAGLKKGED